MLGTMSSKSSNARGHDAASPALSPSHPATGMGAWDLAQAGLLGAARAWRRLGDRDLELPPGSTSPLLAGEEAVTPDLLPLVRAIAGDGRLEEDRFSTAFQYEEVEPVAALRRSIETPAGGRTGPSRSHTRSYRAIRDR